VFLFESILTQQQDEWAVAQGDIALGLIAVYRAIGGGWEIRCNNANTGGEIIQPPAWDGEPLPPPQPQSASDNLDESRQLTHLPFTEITADNTVTLERAATTESAAAAAAATPKQEAK